MDIKFLPPFRLPPVKNNADKMDAFSGTTEWVLARFEGQVRPVFARYFHNIGNWQIDGVHGDFGHPVEWWDIPVVGSGNQVNTGSV